MTARILRGIRRWFLRNRYAPALCLSAAVGVALILVCVLALPSPGTEAATGPNVVAVAQTEEPSVFVTEEMFEELQTTSSASNGETVIYDPEESSKTVTVYAADGAECYHLGDCKFAFASAKRLTPYQAYYLGYRPCGRCNPPVYDPITGVSS